MMTKLNTVALGTIAKSQTGPFGTQLHEKDYVAAGTPIVTVEHLGEIGFTTQNLPFVSDADKERLSKYSLAEGDIVFSRVGSVDRSTYVSSNEAGWLFSGRCLRVRVDKSKANPKYVSYYFRLPEFKKMMSNIAVGATMPSLNTDLMNDIPVVLPDAGEQNKIVEKLSSLDSKIIHNNKINNVLEQTIQLIYHYWFTQFDFPNENGLPYASSGGKIIYSNQIKREIPKDWKVEKLETLLKSVKSNNSRIDSKDILEKGRFPVISQDAGDFISGYTNKEGAIKDVPLIVFGDHSCTLRYVDFPFFKGADGTQLMYFEDNLTPYIYTFLLNILTQIPGYGKYERHYKYIKDLDVLVPDEHTLNQFRLITAPMFTQISKRMLENNKLKELCNWLLPMLITGQIKVNT